jgi:hypothetical protein
VAGAVFGLLPPQWVIAPLDFPAPSAPVSFFSTPAAGVYPLFIPESPGTNRGSFLSVHTRYYHYQLAPPENQVVYPSPVLSGTCRPSEPTGISRYKMLSLDPPLPSSPGYQHYENQHHKNHYRVYQSFIFYWPGLHKHLHDSGHKSITYTTINPMKITNTVHAAIFIHRSIKATLLTILPSSTSNLFASTRALHSSFSWRPTSIPSFFYLLPNIYQSP